MSIFDDTLGALATPPRGRSLRVSSNEQPNWNDGNFDATRLAPGETLQMPVLEGPGVINHIWFTSHAGHTEELNCLSLRIYYDGRTRPGVEVPLGDFFAVGDGPLAVVESFPVQVSPTGALSCYWRIPFRKSCRIAITNDSKDRGTGLYWMVDYVKLDGLPPDTPYFHVAYRQEYPAAMGRDYLIFENKGRGRYVGTVMSATLAQPGWFGEGDDFFYIDGEEVPSLQGTGTEDYFNDAWGFRPRTSHWFGQPRYEGYDTGDRMICYRWHVLDPVCFSKSLQVSIEHKGNGARAEDFWYLERPDFISSAAFWYHVGEPEPFGELPGWPERRVPWQRANLLTRLREAKVSGGPEPKVELHGAFGARPSLYWPDPPEGTELSLPFELDKDGRYAFRVVSQSGPRYGAFDVLLDGQVAAGGVKLTAENYEERLIPLDERDMAGGGHVLAFRARGGGGLMAESIMALRIPLQVNREPKTARNEGHFYRLAVGRAVYAWRLVNGTLPASLDDLISAGYLDERYKRDENDRPMESRIEDGAFHVIARDWTHSWRGLDPRR
ncbi:MAG TPA: DUF2961 domain-containing protein [Candidatus Brocadiia bacterium]|nr:DUF2961 domain-containing protein [Candidatus Brocadiia bacterium]